MTGSYPRTYPDDGTPLGPGVPGRTAQWLWEHGWAFEDASWPATRQLWGRTGQRGREQDDLTLSITPTEWKIGGDYLHIEPGRWSDKTDTKIMSIQVGPFHLSYQRWRARG